MHESLDAVFGALSDPTRRAILDRLRSGERSAGDLARPFAMSQPAVSRHLKTLQAAGLIAQRRQGRKRMFRLEPHPLARIDAWLQDYRRALEGNYQRLDALLQEETDPNDP